MRRWVTSAIPVRVVTLQSSCFFFCSVSRSELVPWLQEQIAEQKRIDAETSGTVIQSEHSQGPSRSTWSGPMPDVQLLLPGDARKQRKQTKQIYVEKGKGRLVDVDFPDVGSLFSWYST